MQENAMPPDGTANIAQSSEALRDKIKAQIVEAKPTFFKLERSFRKQGRTDTPVAASDKLWVVLKTYAADGENGLHAHPNETTPSSSCRRGDVLRAERRTRTIRTKGAAAARHVLLVQGHERRAVGDGCASAPPRSTVSTATPHQPRMAVRCGGDSVENKQVEVIMSDRWFR